MDIAELKAKAAKDGYSPQEVDNFLNMSRNMCERPIVQYLQHIIDVEQKLGTITPQIAEDLTSILKTKLTAETTGRSEITFTEDKNVRLCMQLAILPKNYQFDIRFPPNTSRQKIPQYSKKIFENIDKLAEMAHLYYKELLVRLPEFTALLTGSVPNVNFSDLMLNKNNRTMSFDNKYENWLGIFVYYVNEKNQMFVDKIEAPPTK